MSDLCYFWLLDRGLLMRRLSLRMKLATFVFVVLAGSTLAQSTDEISAK
jgi:hypothetical protein